MRTRTQSSERPASPFIIENIKNGYCTILFFDDIVEVETVDEQGQASIYYDYELYIMENVPYRDTLSDTIQNDLTNWLNIAKYQDRESTAYVIRKKRDKLLANTDWTQMKDTALSQEMQRKYATYRQELRDIPQQEGFPYDVEFPVLEE